MKKCIRVFVLIIAILSMFRCFCFAEGGAEFAVNWLKMPEFDYSDVEYFERNLYVYTTTDGKKGLIDNEGNIIVRAVYDRFERCTCGNILINSTDAIELNIYSYTVDGNATESIHSIYKSLYGYNQSDKSVYALTEADKLMGTVYSGPDAVVFEQVQLAVDMTNGGFKSENYRLGKYGIYTNTGEMIGGDYASAVGYSEGVCAVFNGNKWAYVDENGTFLTDFLYDNSKVSTHVGDEDHVYLLADGLIPVNRDGKWGYLDEFGQERISCVFEKTTPSTDGKAWIQLNGKWGIADFSSIPVIAKTVTITGVASGSLLPGQTVQLSYSSQPSRGTLYWHSSDEQIFTVSGNGQINCLKAGTAEVRVTNELDQEIGKYDLTVHEPGPVTKRFNPTGLIITILSILLAFSLISGGFFIYKYIQLSKKDKT